MEQSHVEDIDLVRFVDAGVVGYLEAPEVTPLEGGLGGAVLIGVEVSEVVQDGDVGVVLRQGHELCLDLDKGPEPVVRTGLPVLRRDRPREGDRWKHHHCDDDEGEVSGSPAASHDRQSGPDGYLCCVWVDPGVLTL